MTKLQRILKMVTIIIAVQIIVGCSSMAPREIRQWQPTAITDFKASLGSGRDF